jgi:hypothetical protein
MGTWVSWTSEDVENDVMDHLGERLMWKGGETRGRNEWMMRRRGHGTIEER